MVTELCGSWGPVVSGGTQHQHPGNSGARAEATVNQDSQQVDGADARGTRTESVTKESYFLSEEGASGRWSKKMGWISAQWG